MGCFDTVGFPSNRHLSEVSFLIPILLRLVSFRQCMVKCAKSGDNPGWSELNRPDPPAG